MEESFDNIFWNFIHCVTLMYPENPNTLEKTNYFILMDALQKIIPCNKCKEFFEKDINGKSINEGRMYTYINKLNQINSKYILVDDEKKKTIEIIQELENDLKVNYDSSTENELNLFKYKLKKIEEDEENEKNIFNNSNNKITFSPIYDSKEKLFNKFVEHHNSVNKKLNKPEYSVDEAKLYYQKFLDNSVMIKNSKN